MMKNMSIRNRILLGVVAVNLLGAIAVVVYLHQSYQASLETAVAKTTNQGLAAWEQLKGLDTDLEPTENPAEVARILAGMKEITDAEYGFLLYKETTTAEDYAAARESLGLPDNWSEGESYAQLISTNDELAADMDFNVAPDSVPEMGKTVGIENGACSKACHDGVTGEGDYWTVRWSNDSSSRAHAVLPVVNADNVPVGVVYGIEDISSIADNARSTMVQTFLMIAITFVVATLFIGGLVDTLIFRRLARTIRTIEDMSVRVAGGDFDAHFVPDGTTDEIGRFEEFFARLMDLMSATLKSLAKKGA